MPPVVPWMTRTDRYILDLLDGAGIVATPKTIHLELHRRHGEDVPSNRQISRRLKTELSEHGLVDQPFADEARPYYELSELGKRFLHDSDAEPAEFITKTDGTSE
jgi:repressor of nif and glnA expression